MENFLSWLHLALISLLPAVFSFVFVLIGRFVGEKKLSTTPYQIIIGLSFGLLAVLGNEFGIEMNGALVNCRDGAVLRPVFFLAALPV